MEAQSSLSITPTKEMDEKILMMLNQSLYRQKLIPMSVFKKVEQKILNQKH